MIKRVKILLFSLVTLCMPVGLHPAAAAGNELFRRVKKTERPTMSMAALKKLGQARAAAVENELFRRVKKTERPTMSMAALKKLDQARAAAAASAASPSAPSVEEPPKVTLPDPALFTSQELYDRVVVGALGRDPGIPEASDLETKVVRKGFEIRGRTGVSPASSSVSAEAEPRAVERDLTNELEAASSAAPATTAAMAACEGASDPRGVCPYSATGRWPAVSGSAAPVSMSEGDRLPTALGRGPIGSEPSVLSTPPAAEALPEIHQTPLEKSLIRFLQRPFVKAAIMCPSRSRRWLGAFKEAAQEQCSVAKTAITDAAAVATEAAQAFWAKHGESITDVAERFYATVRPMNDTYSSARELAQVCEHWKRERAVKEAEFTAAMNTCVAAALQLDNPPKNIWGEYQWSAERKDELNALRRSHETTLARFDARRDAAVEACIKIPPALLTALASRNEPLALTEVRVAALTESYAAARASREDEEKMLIATALRRNEASLTAKGSVVFSTRAARKKFENDLVAVDRELGEMCDAAFNNPGNHAVQPLIEPAAAPQPVTGRRVGAQARAMAAMMAQQQALLAAHFPDDAAGAGAPDGGDVAAAGLAAQIPEVQEPEVQANVPPVVGAQPPLGGAPIVPPMFDSSLARYSALGSTALLLPLGMYFLRVYYDWMALYKDQALRATEEQEELAPFSVYLKQRIMQFKTRSDLVYKIGLPLAILAAGWYATQSA